MKLHISIVCVLLAAAIGAQGWALKEIISLKADVAAIRASLHMTIATNQK